MQRERWQALKKRVSEAEARSAADGAARADAEKQRDVAKAGNNRKDTSLRVAREQLTKVEAQLDLLVQQRAEKPPAATPPAAAPETTTTTTKEQQRQVLLLQKRHEAAAGERDEARASLERSVAAIRSLASDLGHGVVRARQRAAEAENESKADVMVAASVLDMSPPELADLLDELGDATNNLQGGRRPTPKPKEAVVPAEVTNFVHVVDAALGPPLDDARLRDAFQTMLEERLELERILGSSFKAGGRPSPNNNSTKKPKRRLTDRPPADYYAAS